jgi:hypothetical protein
MGKRTLLTIAFLILAFAGAYWVGAAIQRTPHQQQLPPTSLHTVEGLAVADADLKVGEVWEQKEFVCRLPIHNHTGEDIEVLDFIKSCSCTQVEPRSLTIPAGGEATVRLKIDLAQRSVAELGQAVRPFTIEVRPYLKKRKSPRDPGWVVEGTVKSRVTLDTKAVHFGERPVYGQPPVKQKVLATVHVPAEKLEATLDKKVATVEINRNTEDPSKYDVVLATEPSLLPGDFEANLLLDVVTPIGERLTGVMLPVAGKVQPEVRLLPAKLLLGSKPVGLTAEAVVTLQAPPAVNAEVDHVEVDSPGLQVEPVTVEGLPAGRTYVVRQRVLQRGDQNSTAKFVIRKWDKSLETLAVEVTYRGE